MRAWVFAVLATVGCNLDRDTSQPDPPTRAPKRVVVAAPEPLPKPAEPPAAIAKVDLSLGAGYEMRRPIQDGRLTLIPIVAKIDAPPQKFITLHDGMRRGVVAVREVGYEWEVDIVRISNRSSEPLVVIAGELIEDAMQDRVTAENTVILAGKTESVQVRCVEEDRDHGGIVFHAGNALAELALRRTVVHQDQDSVWQKVKQINRRDGISTPTNTYRHAAHAQSKLAERSAALLAQLEAREERSKIVGLAVAIDGQVIAIDRFATPELYRALEPELLASYLPATAGPQAEGKKISPADVRALMQMPGATAANTASTIVLRPI
jgi:hypothetical protein